MIEIAHEDCTLTIAHEDCTLGLHLETACWDCTLGIAIPFEALTETGLPNLDREACLG